METWEARKGDEVDGEDSMKMARRRSRTSTRDSRKFEATTPSPGYLSPATSADVTLPHGLVLSIHSYPQFIAKHTTAPAILVPAFGQTFV